MNFFFVKPYYGLKISSVLIVWSFLSSTFSMLQLGPYIIDTFQYFLYLLKFPCHMIFCPLFGTQYWIGQDNHFTVGLANSTKTSKLNGIGLEKSSCMPPAPPPIHVVTANSAELPNPLLPKIAISFYPIQSNPRCQMGPQQIAYMLFTMYLQSDASLFCSTLQLLNHAKLNFLFGYTQTVSSLIFMQQSYPRTACIRKGWVIRQLIKCLIFTGLMGFIIEQVIYSYICFSNYRLISNCNAILPEYFCSILTQLSRIRNTR